MNQKSLKTIKWFARILALLILLGGLPFYFGYGNPLPFANQGYSIWDNLMLAMYPLVFTGLILGWRFEKTGGWLVVVPLIVVILLGLATSASFMVNILLAMIPGALYLVAGYKKSEPLTEKTVF